MQQRQDEQQPLPVLALVVTFTQRESHFGNFTIILNDATQDELQFQFSELFGV